jgi:hypothetical protein
MSNEKAALEKAKGHIRNANALMVISRPIAVLLAIISLTFSFGLAVPTLAQAQTASGLPVDANGWTIFTASSDTRIVYVSSSSGSDSTGVVGDVNHPYKTIATGLSLLRPGYPDWLLLKKGDTWVESNQLTKSGRSPAEPMLISSYGTGARPLINVENTVTTNNGFLTCCGKFGGNYTAIVGLELYAYRRDPNSLNYDAAHAGYQLTGINFMDPISWLLIEDCKLSFFSDNIMISGDGNPNPSTGVTIRRSVITNSFINSETLHSQGLLISGSTLTTLEENFFDHNGWNELFVISPTQLQFNHNMYLQTGPNTVRGNIFSNDASGSQMRAGGTLENNLWVHNPYAHNFGMPNAAPSYVTSNVYLEGVDMPTSPPAGYGWGFNVFSNYAGHDYNVGTVTIANNIIANSFSANGFGISLDSGTHGNTVTNNIIFNWRVPIDNQSTGNTVSNNQLDTVGTNNNPGGTAPAEPFPNPTRSVGGYYATLGLGGTGLLSDFLSAARRQRKDNWSPALTAAAVNDYIRAGFGITSGATSSTPIPTPTADTTAPSVPAGVVATAISDTQVNLSWTASSDNVGVTGYKVFRNGVQVSTTSNSSYQDTGLSAGTTAIYTISAYDAAGNTSAQSSSVSVTTPASTAASPPSVDITSPKSGATTNGSVNIAVFANSAIGIKSITIMGDGNPLATCTNVSSCSTTWQKKKISRGTHSVSAIAVDMKGSLANATVTVTALMR